MSPDKGSGIADDADAYEDLPEAEEDPASPAHQAPPRAMSGIASDADQFEGLLEESTDAVQRLDSSWLYQVHGQVFGPIPPKDLLEMLYRGEITAETPIAPEDGEFLPLRRIGAFRAHLPKVEAHLKALEAARAQEREEGRRRLKQRLAWGGAAVALAVFASVGITYWVRHSKATEAEAQKQAQEALIKAELDALLASVTIEPPLMEVVSEDAAREKKARRGRRRRGSRAVARFSGGAPKSGELSRQEIMAGVGRAFPGFKRCIVQQIQRDAESVPEQIVMTFSIDNEGRAQQVALSDRFLRGSPLEACMGRKLGKVRWRAYQGEVQNVEYPITVGRR